MGAKMSQKLAKVFAEKTKKIIKLPDYKKPQLNNDKKN